MGTFMFICWRLILCCTSSKERLYPETYKINFMITQTPTGKVGVCD